MSVVEPSVPAMLGEQARQRPDAPAYTFIDYEVDSAGYSQSLTWSQAHQRAQVLAAELASCGSPGDRVAICAPQGLEYIVGLLGAMEAGFIAVPLSVPLFGAHDERVSAALKDYSPAAMLTTSAVVNDVVSCAHGLPGRVPTEITGGRVAAISVLNDRSEQLVAIVELKKRGGSDEEILDRFHTIKRDVTSAISKSQGLRLADLVLVPPGSIPITTSGKVRRSTSVERYRRDEFTRLGVPA
ncbi:MAG: long-chain fatty acid adenylase/transferase FadD26 [Mycobacterium sp.]|jgi:acyl-CoA synthetase (AMP-forming)/AMP-acid ligase II|nr:long-chain fatty acid adenylase/transferase FadD26 [Mycobacterium sp.]